MMMAGGVRLVATLALALAQVLVLVLVTLVMLATQLRVIVRATPPVEEASRRRAWSPPLLDMAHDYDYDYDDAWGLRPRPSSRQPWPLQHPAGCLRRRRWLSGSRSGMQSRAWREVALVRKWSALTATVHPSVATPPCAWRLPVPSRCWETWWSTVRVTTVVLRV